MKKNEKTRGKMIKELRDALDAFLEETQDYSFERPVKKCLEDALESDESFYHYVALARQDIEARILNLAEKLREDFYNKEVYMKLFIKFSFPQI